MIIVSYSLPFSLAVRSIFIMLNFTRVIDTKINSSFLFILHKLIHANLMRSLIPCNFELSTNPKFQSAGFSFATEWNFCYFIVSCFFSVAIQSRFEVRKSQAANFQKKKNMELFSSKTTHIQNYCSFKESKYI